MSEIFANQADGDKEMKKNSNQTKSRIVEAAWKLFYQYGYENTTIDDIAEASQTSKGTFYHYFDSKDDLLGSISYLFDKKYEELEETMDPALDPIQKLLIIVRQPMNSAFDVGLLAKQVMQNFFVFFFLNDDPHMPGFFGRCILVRTSDHWRALDTAGC